MVTKRYYYGFSHSHGANMCRQPEYKNGAYISHRAGQMFRFSSKQERDRWVDSGSSFYNERDFREAVASNDPELRRMIAMDNDRDTPLRWAHMDEYIPFPDEPGYGYNCEVFA